MIKAARQQHMLIKTALSIFFLVLVFGTVLFHYIEGWNFVDSFYFTTTTVTTLGYGDIVPTSSFSRIITALFAIIGVSLVLTVLSAFAGTFITFSRTTQKLHKKLSYSNKNPIEKSLRRVAKAKSKFNSLRTLRLRKKDKD